MDITQPDSGQQQPDDVSGGDGVESATSNGETGSTPKPSAPNQHQLDRRAAETETPQRFAAVLAEVDAVDERPLADHNDVFTRAHRELTDALNDVERGDS
ncbi:hypothetical protein CLV47_113113 [Antricoccus suffuscus]|uniref:Uncharacterized protein n=1 Tax=Antricoccus suffuscus TaxID=1629062 RepID=A0A2T0ZXI1_9ACTN|nr:hypothetical protein [Antricoccus suffuscus]PRZ40947.1 hypothetical protein CLV47_113113 [Antricoccus suffuscus]